MAISSLLRSRNATFVLLALGCGEHESPAGAQGTTTGPGTSESTQSVPVSEPPQIRQSFTESADDVLNPERGFYDGVDLVRGGDFSSVREAGMTLAYAGVRLDDYRDAPLDAVFLDALDAGFADARSAGIKVVLRFVYNADIAPDASRARIEEHLGQLQPVLAANADVIAVMQAGFIGAWGEWHSSTNGLDNPADRAAVLAAILAALPESRMTQVRTPMFKDEAYGGPLTDAEAFAGSAAARVGHHNDCFLASEDDFGTYDDPVEDWKDFVATEGRFTPVGGETCVVNAPRTDCEEAVAELGRLHWSFLNSLYRQEVLDGWEAQGCLETVRRGLGYRLHLAEAAWSERVAPGGILHLTLSIDNLGMASLFNPRSVVITLGDEEATVSVDPRLWASGARSEVDLRLRVPASLAPGSYRLAFSLPDPLLPDDPRYAVRLATDDLWQEPDHVLTEMLAIDADAPGDVDPGATALLEMQ